MAETDTPADATSRQPSTQARMQVAARLAAQGKTNSAIAEAVACDRHTIGEWRALPEFRALLDQEAAYLREVQVGSFVQAIDLANRQLVDDLRDPDAEVRRQAMALVLRVGAGRAMAELALPTTQVVEHRLDANAAQQVQVGLAAVIDAAADAEVIDVEPVTDDEPEAP